MTMSQKITVQMTDVKNIVPTAGLAGFCVLDKDINTANPEFVLTGGAWASQTPETPENEKAVDVIVVMSRLTDVGGQEPGYFVTSNYINALKNSGANPILVDYNQDPEKLAEQYPGAMLVGGFAPFDDAWYGDNPVSPYKDNESTNAKRAEFEIKILDAFMKQGKPVLGICNGMQVMAASKGATLTGSITESFGDAIHSHCGADAAHPIKIVQNTQLSNVFGKTNEIEMTSFHNEAVIAVPENGDIIVNAISDDGIIEGIELKGGHPFTIGIQGHPEHYAAGIREGKGGLVVEQFVQECETIAAGPQ